MTSPLRRTREGAVLRLTLDDDATRNSLSEDMMAALQRAFDEAAADKTVGVIVLAAAGKVFSSATISSSSRLIARTRMRESPISAPSSPGARRS